MPLQPLLWEDRSVAWQEFDLVVAVYTWGYVLRLADRHIRTFHATGHTVMVQPYQRSVDTAGESALIFLADRFSHAVNKGPLLEADAGVVDALWERQVITATDPPADHLAVAEAAIGAVGQRLGPTTYARVDVLDGNDGRPRVLEVELIEPSLFLTFAPAATETLVAAIRHRLSQADRAR